MEIKIQAIRFQLREELKTFLEKRLQKLKTFYHAILHAEVYLRLEPNDPEANKQVEIKLHVSGTELFAKAAAETFEAATTKTVESLRRQLRRFKGKHSPEG